MKVKGLTPQQIQRIARKLGYRLLNERSSGRFHAFTIRMALNAGVGRDKYRARGSSNPDRWGNGAVCFHGHFAFFRAIFEANPAALIVTCKRRWASFADLISGAPALGMENVGPMMSPRQYREKCDCTLTDANPEEIY